MRIYVLFTVSFQAILTEFSQKFACIAYLYCFGSIVLIVAGVSILVKIFESYYFKFKYERKKKSGCQLYIQQLASLELNEDEKVKENDNVNKKEKGKRKTKEKNKNKRKVKDNSVIEDDNDHLNK